MKDKLNFINCLTKSHNMTNNLITNIFMIASIELALKQINNIELDWIVLNEYGENNLK